MSCTNNNIKICTQTNIPQVDNDLIECSDCGFTSANCIIIPESLGELNLSENSSLTLVINTLINEIVNLKDRVTVLETP